MLLLDQLLDAAGLSLSGEVCGIDVSRFLKFDSGFLQLVLIAQELAFADVFGGRVEAHAGEGREILRVPGLEVVSLAVLLKGFVVVVLGFRLNAALEGGTGLVGVSGQ